MSVLVDTTVWSLALRRRRAGLNARERLLVMEWTQLVRTGRARIIGLVRQEVLSGIKHHPQFEALRATLRAFADERVDTEDHEAAARAGNKCRSMGIAVTAADMLICAVAERRGMSVFSSDPDFGHYARVLPVKVHLLTQDRAIS